MGFKEAYDGLWDSDAKSETIIKKKLGDDLVFSRTLTQSGILTLTVILSLTLDPNLNLNLNLNLSLNLNLIN